MKKNYLGIFLLLLFLFPQVRMLQTCTIKDYVKHCYGEINKKPRRKLWSKEVVLEESITIDQTKMLSQIIGSA